MQNIGINHSKVLFIEMDEYNEFEANIKGGGASTDQNGYRYEIFNFPNDNGSCYGYTPPYSKVKLSRISTTINHDALGDYIDDVFVVFTCSRELGGIRRAADSTIPKQEDFSMPMMLAC